MSQRSGLWALFAVLMACRQQQAEQQGRAEPERCGPVAGELPVGSRLDGLEGGYRLRMAAITGQNKGAAVDGRLRLEPNDTGHLFRSRLPGGTRDTTARYPYFGTAEIDLEAVDAVRPGDLAALDPDAPGVLVIESPNEVMLRFGSEANRSDVVRFEGGYTVLRVRRIEADGFQGNWSSGGPMPTASGYFCAKRAADSL
jgi:hypothetical protein